MVGFCSLNKVSELSPVEFIGILSFTYEDRKEQIKGYSDGERKELELLWPWCETENGA